MEVTAPFLGDTVRRYAWQTYSPEFPLYGVSTRKFDPQRLIADLNSLKDKYGEGGNTRFAQPGWTAICLHSRNGDVFDDEKAEEISLYRETEALNYALYFKQILNEIRAEGVKLKRVRLSLLQPGQLIPWHVDGRAYRVRRNRDCHLRLHIPIFTTPDVLFRIGPYQMTLSPGEFLNFEVAYPHQVYNGSNEVRVHLLIDCKAPYSFLESNFNQMTSGRYAKRLELKAYFDRSLAELQDYKRSFKRWSANEDQDQQRAILEQREFASSVAANSCQVLPSRRNTSGSSHSMDGASLSE